MADEQSLLKAILIKASSIHNRLFRNNTGSAWGGKLVLRATKTTTATLNKGDIVLRNARPIKFGLCVGSSDLIGWTRVEISENMVGQTVAIFTACEVKAGSTKTTKLQSAFIEAVNINGGIGFVAKSEDDYALRLASFKLQGKKSHESH